MSDIERDFATLQTALWDGDPDRAEDAARRLYNAAQNARKHARTWASSPSNGDTAQ